MPETASAVPDTDAALPGEAAALVSLMTDEQLAAQVIMAGVDARGPPDAAETERLRRIPAGAVMLFRKNLDTDAASIRRMTDRIRAEAGLRLGEDARIEPFIAVDHEGGDVHRFTSGVERLPAPLSYFGLAERNGREAALYAVEADAARSAAELAALGITMNLAPLAETLTEENKAFLRTRSYGPDPDFTAAAAAAFMRGMKAAGIACVIKHFPGNSGADPHLGASRLDGDEEALRQTAAPFARLVAVSGGGAPPAAVMVSHVIVPAWDEGRSASLSGVAMGQKLRGELGFNGIILADDFSMGAVSGGYGTAEKSVAALAAGADMVMAWPRNLVGVHNAILAALADGRLTRARLRNAAYRIVREKLRRAAAPFPVSPF